MVAQSAGFSQLKVQATDPLSPTRK